MKKLFLFAIIMLISLSVNAQESGDSVKSKKIDKIKICKSKYEDSMKGEVDLSFRLNVGMNTRYGCHCRLVSFWCSQLMEHRSGCELAQIPFWQGHLLGKGRG